MTTSRSTADESVITYTPTVRRDDRLEWSGHLASDKTYDVDIAFTWPGRRYRSSARPWLLTFLTAAMRSSRSRLVVDGPIDAGTHDGLMEWQELHHRWWPEHTRVVQIRADIEPAPKVPRNAGAVTAFSGGVDSAFSLLRHSPAATGGVYRQTQLTAGLMVHGFDISHGSDDHFPAAWERSRRMMEAHGVTPLMMRTNMREVGWKAKNHDWGKVGHGPALAAALACVEQAHDVVLIPSSYPYELYYQWGSSPVSDPLMSSAARPIWHDGGAYDKLDKVLAIAGDRAIADDLRVCWVGKQHDRNCGHCFKCLMTQACYWIAGVADPGAFDQPADISELAVIALDDSYKNQLARHMVAEATTRGRVDIAASLTLALDAVEVG